MTTTNFNVSDIADSAFLGPKWQKLSPPDFSRVAWALNFGEGSNACILALAVSGASMTLPLHMRTGNKLGYSVDGGSVSEINGVETGDGDLSNYTLDLSSDGDHEVLVFFDCPNQLLLGTFQYTTPTTNMPITVTGAAPAIQALYNGASIVYNDTSVTYDANWAGGLALKAYATLRVKVTTTGGDLLVFGNYRHIRPRVDGTDLDNLDPGSAQAYVTASPYNSVGQAAITVATLAAGTHEIVLTNTSELSTRFALSQLVAENGTFSVTSSPSTIEISVYGDSITNGGDGDLLGQQYGYVLSTSQNANVTNWGLGGQRVHTYLRDNTASMTATEPGIIINFGGANDFLYIVDNSYVPIATFATSYRAMLQNQLDETTDTIIVACPMIPRGGGPNGEGKTVADFSAVIAAQVADINNPRCVYLGNTDYGLNLATDYFPDELHPNATGHAKIAAVIAAFLASLNGPAGPALTISDLDTSVAPGEIAFGTLTIGGATYSGYGSVTITSSHGSLITAGIFQGLGTLVLTNASSSSTIAFGVTESVSGTDTLTVLATFPDSSTFGDSDSITVSSPSTPTGLSATVSGTTTALALAHGTANNYLDFFVDGVLNASVFATTTTGSVTLTGITAGDTVAVTVKDRDIYGNSSSATSAVNITTWRALTVTAVRDGSGVVINVSDDDESEEYRISFKGEVVATGLELADFPYTVTDAAASSGTFTVEGYTDSVQDAQGSDHYGAGNRSRFGWLGFQPVLGRF